MRRMRLILVNLAVIVVSTVVALLLVEIGLRFAYVDEPFTLRNLAADEINYRINNIAIIYDPVIGYVPRPDFRGGLASTTGELGIRLNHSLQPGEPSPPLQTGGILAVGDSFTFGSEVNDDEAWPADLERILGIPVVNGGSGGYGYDQSILRAEQLLDRVKPRLIIIGCIPNCTERNDYSVNGGLVKTYFDIVDDKLVLKNVPAPDYEPSRAHFGRMRLIFGHLYLSTWVAERLGYGSVWKFNGKYETRPEHDYGYRIACLLWKRLADRVAGQNIRLVALTQYSGQQVTLHDNHRQSQHSEETLECARRYGFVTVDSFPELRQRLAADKRSFWNLWVKEPSDQGEPHNGHMSKDGNRFTAELLAATIRAEMPEVLRDAPAVVSGIDDRQAQESTR
jgi:hypothetical protein